MQRTIAVYGSAYGPSLIIVARPNPYHETGHSGARVCEAIEEALSEADKRFGDRIDVGDRAFRDYPGDTLEAKVEEAIASGEARYTDGGTLVWVDPHEWVRIYRNGRALRKDLRDWSLRRIPVVVI